MPRSMTEPVWVTDSSQTWIRSEKDQAVSDSDGDRLCARGGAEFAENRGNVEFGGVIGNVEAGGDFFVTKAGGQHLQNFALSASEGFCQLGLRLTV
jgi:hypothetical protein